jgi:hypothetical protein
MESDLLQSQSSPTTNFWEIATVNPLNPALPVQPSLMPEPPQFAGPTQPVGGIETVAADSLQASTATVSDPITPDPTRLMADFFGTVDWLTKIPPQYVQLSLTAFAASRFAAGDFSFFPPIKVVPAATLGDQSSKFDSLTGSLYLSDRFLADNASQPFVVVDAMFDVLLTHPDIFLDLGALAATEFSILTSTLDVAYNNGQLHLQSLFSQPDWMDLVAVAFGSSFDREKAAGVASAFLSGELSLQDVSKVVPAEVLQGAIAVYDNSSGMILLSDVLVNTENLDPEVIAEILLEEFGHYIDAQINSKDSQGDEGQMFSAIVLGKTLTPEDLNVMKSEDDRALLIIDGQVHLVEQSASNVAIL